MLLTTSDYVVNNTLSRGIVAPVTGNSIAPDVFQHLQKATASDPAELAELYREYLAEARQAVAQLRSAMLRKDAGQFRERAHYLRGSSLIVGATAVAQCCSNLELLDRSSESRDAARLLDQVSAALQVIETDLAARLGPAVIPAEGSAA